MTPLYFDSFIGCYDSFTNDFEMATSAKCESLFDKILDFIR